MRKASKGRNKRETGNRKSTEGNINQNTETRNPSTAGSSCDPGRSRITVCDFEVKRNNAMEQAILIAIQEKEEREQRIQEMAELQTIWDKNMQLMKESHEGKILQAKWARFMKCDGSPDPVNQREINTYISLRFEDKSCENAETVLNDCKLDLQLIEELKFLMLDSPLDVLSEGERSVYQKTVEELQTLIMYKLDMATLQVMCDATVLSNKETGNLQHAVMIDEIALCVWGNIMKNARIRSFEFPEINYTFEIPRIIALTDCAIRIITTKFDHYSPTCKSFLPHLKKILEDAKNVEAEPGNETKEQEPGEEKEEVEGNKDPTGESEENEDNIEQLLAASSDGSIKEEAKGEEVEKDEVEPAFIDPPTPEPSEWEEYDEDDVVDLRLYNILGNIYHFNLLQLPPQPKYVGSWTIAQMVDPPEIYYLEYMADSESSKDVVKKDERHPIAISLIIASDVLCLEQPQVARWDYERKLWTTLGFSDLVYSEESMTVTFKTTHFGTFCLLQDAHIHMPFQKWEIRPHTLNSAVFTITTTLFEVQIEIENELCCLTKPNRPEINSIINIWVTPAELIVMMQKAGINIFPSEDSAKNLTIQYKHPWIEKRLYQQIALTASAIAYSWSKWNFDLNESNEIIFQAVENMEDEPVKEETWLVFLTTKSKVCKLLLVEDEYNDDSIKMEKKTSEDDNRGSSKILKPPHQIKAVPVTKTGPSKRIKVKEGCKSFRNQFAETFNVQKSPFKSNMYHLISTFASDNALARINTTNFKFVNCVYNLLTATKVLTFS